MRKSSTPISFVEVSNSICNADETLAKNLYGESFSADVTLAAAILDPDVNNSTMKQNFSCCRTSTPQLTSEWKCVSSGMQLFT